jgi:exopolyphosphatase/guanosine-5'-triphosphate,3'-diphosphate pyrophosphatase
LKLAAIDLGSNSIKLVVVEAAAADSFSEIASEREIIRLGQETLRDKHISAAATLRAVNCLKHFRSIAERHGAESIVAIATAFLREVVAGTEEARLIGLAAAHGCATKELTTLNIDIGGGSTEFSLFRDDEPLKLLSIKLGAVGLTDRFIRSDPPNAEELNNLRSEIRVSLRGTASELREQRWDHTTATSGTAVTLGAMLSHTTISLRVLQDLNAKLASLKLSDRRTVAGLPPQRADIIVAGGFVLEEVMNALKIESVRLCDWSLREGVIIDRLRGL